MVDFHRGAQIFLAMRLALGVEVFVMATNTENPLSELAAAMGRRGGKARLVKMTSEERSRIARLAAQARWQRKTQPLPPTPDGGGPDGTSVPASDNPRGSIM